MRLARFLAVAGTVAAVVAGAASAAPFELVQAGGAVYPQRSFILTLPAPRSLAASQVHVTENGVPVNGISLVRQGAAANSKSAVVLEIDESLTMAGKPITDALTGARTFAAQANPDEEIAIVTFNGKVDVVQPLTYSASVVDSALSHVPTLAYGTKNYDALETGLALITAAHVSSGSIIILTDGQSVGSLVEPTVALGALARAHVRVFAIGLLSPAYDPAALEQMASVTHGAYVEATSSSKLAPVLVQIGSRLSNEYLLNYRSLANPDTHVSVGVSVQGVPGVASTAYVTPALDIVPALASRPSTSSRVIQSPYTLIAVVLVIAVLLAFALANLTAQRSGPLLERVGGFVTLTPDPRQQPKRVEPKERRREASRRARLLRGAQQSLGWTERLNETLELADINATALQVILLTAIATVLGAFVGDALLGPIGLLGAVLLVPYLARYLVLRKLRRKRRAFAEQLPDNLDVLASALRAGHSLVGALTVVADDAPEPSRSEYQRVLAEEQLGVQLEDALKIAAIRMENHDLEQIALVARLQREMGSNSAEVLDRVIETVRGRMELRRLVQSLTAQGRLSRVILTGLPIVLAGVLALVDSSYMHPLFHKLLGQVMLGIVAVMVVLGSVIMGRIVDIKA